MNKTLLSLLVLASLGIAFVVYQVLFIRLNGSPVGVPEIPRDIQESGNGKPLRFAVMGDSTAVSQGSDYSDGFAFASTVYLSRTFTVHSINTGVSGATTDEVARDQLERVAAFKPDIVLLAAGANDTTHLTRAETTRRAIQQIVDELRALNPNVQIIVTASPAMDSVTRFPHGAKELLGLRTKQVNAVFNELIEKNDLIHAPIAQKTRDAFIADPTLTAADNFHPNGRGYALWIPVINESLDTAITRLSTSD